MTIPSGPYKTIADHVRDKRLSTQKQEHLRIIAGVLGGYAQELFGLDEITLGRELLEVVAKLRRKAELSEK